MTILYSAKSTIDTEGRDAYRITKFADGEVESSYLTTPGSCNCPAGVRPSCRHRQMLLAMIAEDIINTQFFYDFDRKLVTDFDGIDVGPRPSLGQPDLPRFDIDYTNSIGQSPASEALQGSLSLEPFKPAIPSPATWRRF